MNTSTKATIFKELHLASKPLRLTNAWDAGSARLFESLGAPAIATTSAGIAWSLGYQDRDVLPLKRHLDCISGIARVINVPLSVDIEGGYTSQSADIGDTVARFIDAGAVGINIQDGTYPPQVLCNKIEAARNTAEKLGIQLYINARTDVFVRPLVPEGARVQEALDRAKQYHAAGADGLFVLGGVDAGAIQVISQSTPLFLNVIAWPGQVSVDELGKLGVRRVSLGSWIPQTLWAQATQLASNFLQDGLSNPLCADAAPYAQVDAILGDNVQGN